MTDTPPQDSVFSRADDRDRVTVLLAFLTSPECQAACRQYARPEELAAAISRLWFDEVYVPAEKYLDEFKGHPCDLDLARFDACFTEGELAALARFHGFWELRLGFVTNSAGGRAFFPENDSWRGLIKHAEYVLAELEPDAKRIQDALAAYVTRALTPAIALREALEKPKLLNHPTPRHVPSLRPSPRN